MTKTYGWLQILYEGKQDNNSDCIIIKQDGSELGGKYSFSYKQR